MNFFSFCLFGNCNFSSLSKDNFARYRILGWQFLSCSTLNISAYCLLSSKISDEKSTDNFIEDFLYLTVYFSLAAFKIFSCFCLWKYLFFIICLTEGLFEFIIHGICWASRMFMLSSDLESFQPLFLQIFSQIPFSSSETPLKGMLVHLSHRSLGLCLLFFNPSPFCSLDLVISIALSPSLPILSFVQICHWI